MNDTSRHPGPTILYVEDDAMNRELMRSVIGKRPRLRLVTAGTGSEAVAAASAEAPELILLDRHLPDMDGDEVLELLRARPSTAHIPVLVVSGDSARPHAGDAARGVIGYLTKPYEVRELLSWIDRVFDPA